jgi:hypothetical protein
MVEPMTNLDSDEFMLTDGQTEIVITKHEQWEFREILDLQKRILDAKNERASPNAETPSILTSASRFIGSRIVPPLLFKEMTNLAMWWYCVVWGVANFYALAYVHAFSRWRKTLKV